MTKPLYSDNTYVFNSSILREYDIRGIVDISLSEKDAFFLGRSFASFINKNGSKDSYTICVGLDARLSSPKLKDSLIEGLVSSGIKVINIGCGGTPMLYFSSVHLNADAAIMVTGSHNPPEYNGFKFLKDDLPLTGQEIQSLGHISKKGDFIDKKGSVIEKSVDDYYIDMLKELFPKERNIKVVWDPGNGAVGDVLKKLCSSVLGNHILINEEVDGNFPSHHPDPSIKENMKDLIEKVKQEKADIGFAFDGDGDRIGLVTEKGEIVNIDDILILFSRYSLKKFPNSKIIADVKTSKIFFDDVKECGGIPVMWKTGHSLIKLHMKKIDAIFAGESSGHIFFRENYGFDDAIYAAIKFLNMLVEEKTPLSSLLEDLPSSISTGEVRIDINEVDKFEIVSKIKEYIYSNKKYADIIDIDGIRVSFAEGWWLIRASNTQSALVVCCEATSLQYLEEMKEEILYYLSLFGITGIAI